MSLLLTAVAAALVGAATASQGRPQFNNSVCPSFSELQSPHVVANFTIDDLPGFYYELALHDLTQYPLCPLHPRCISSNKTLGVHPDDGVHFVNDSWNLYCGGGYYPQTLLFNLTDHDGYLEGYVPVTKIPFLPPSVVAKAVFPDTVVDFKAGPDGWVLEFQCLHALGRVVFTGINFYSKTNTEAAYQEMLAAGKARGIDFYWNQGLGLSRVNHTGCPSPPQSPPQVMREGVNEDAVPVPGFAAALQLARSDDALPRVRDCVKTCAGGLFGTGGDCCDPSKTCKLTSINYACER